MGQRAFSVLGGLSLMVLGAVLGITADRVLHEHSGGGASIHEEALLHFQRQFDLDDEQVQAIDVLFRQHQEAVDSSWRELRPHVLSAIDSVHAHIESILKPGQREMFRAWVAGQSGDATHQTHDRAAANENADPPRP